MWLLKNLNENEVYIIINDTGELYAWFWRKGQLKGFATHYRLSSAPNIVLLRKSYLQLWLLVQGFHKWRRWCRQEHRSGSRTCTWRMIHCWSQGPECSSQVHKSTADLQECTCVKIEWDSRGNLPIVFLLWFSAWLCCHSHSNMPVSPPVLKWMLQQFETKDPMAHFLPAQADLILYCHTFLNQPVG